MLEQALVERKALYERRLRDLAFEKAGLQERIVELDKVIWGLDGAIAENEQVLRDVQTDAAITGAAREAGAAEKATALAGTKVDKREAN